MINNNILIPNSIIRQIEQNTHLLFLDEDPLHRVCYAASPELRDEFKTSFTLYDVYCYFIGSRFRQTKNVDTIKLKTEDLQNLPLPRNADEFWVFVQQGNKIYNRQ